MNTPSRAAPQAWVRMAALSRMTIVGDHHRGYRTYHPGIGIAGKNRFKARQPAQPGWSGACGANPGSTCKPRIPAFGLRPGYGCCGCKHNFNLIPVGRAQNVSEVHRADLEKV